ncbi:MAG: cysteine desulfurase CsdA [Flavobacteriales bacterium]|mgnify:CR=1 FL=1|nr:cysteine desulfurase CsdA [Flavobacteriales bacterium]
MQTITQKFNVEEVRKDFPILQREVNGKRLVYLDNGATAQKPQSVIDSLNNYYTQENANIHRGVHTLSQEATSAYEEARVQMREFLNAQHTEEIIFTKGTTDGINLVASSFGRFNLKEGDEILITAMEHHSNIVPWQMICEEKGAKLKVAPINDQGELILDELYDLITERTKLVAIVHISNTLGTVNPVKEIIAKAHEKGAKVLVDGAQSAPHMQVDVRDLDADFYVFSMHKVFGPTGVGILYGKKEILESLPPYQGGGDMIKTVTFEKTTYNELPHKFEAGTPNIADGIATKAALDYLQQFSWDEIHNHEMELLEYATKRLKTIEGLRIIGEAKEKASVISFVIDGVHAYDLGVLVDKMGVAVRTGHHCTQPLMERFGILGTVRASFAFYNTKEEIDVLVNAIERAKNMLI